MTSIPQRLLGEALLRSAATHPGKTAIIVKGIEYSYAELKDHAERLAMHLLNSGVRKGDRVAVYMSNSWESAVAVFGILLVGGVFLVINPQTRSNKLAFILADSGSKVLITESALDNEIKTAVALGMCLEQLIVAGRAGHRFDAGTSGIASVDFDSVMRTEVVGHPFPRIIPNDLAALIYTSGSTGFPKGVMMTHQSMVFTTWSLIEYLRLSDHDRILLVLPLAFDYGLYQLLMAVTLGGTLIVEQSFVYPAVVYENINRLEPTVFPGVPTIYAMMIASHRKNGLSFPCIRTVTNTAAALPADFIPDLKRIFPNALIFRMYGLTECKRVCYLEPELLDAKPASVGKAIPGTEVFLLSPDGADVPPGEPGILHVRGPHVMAGYWNHDELNGEMLKPGKIPGERILCSNDYFRMDDEGFLYFLGRTDDIIKTRGEKVSPVEIENVIHSLAGVREAAVVGIPDEVTGESIVAFVTVHDSASIDENSVRRACMNDLESFMIPKRIVFVSEMPKSPNGKIDKNELKKKIAADEV